MNHDLIKRLEERAVSEYSGEIRSLLREAASAIRSLERQNAHHRDLLQAYSDMAKSR